MNIIKRALHKVGLWDDTHSITINVTRSEIDQGVRASGSNCPIGLALRHMFPDALEVRVSHVEVQVVFLTHSLAYTNSDALSEWIIRFDKDGMGSPASFTAVFSRRVEHDGFRQANLRRWYGPPVDELPFV